MLDSSAEVRRNANVPDADLADYLSEEERALLGQALSALRRERGKAWNVACDRAEAQSKRRPSLKSYGIEEIKRWLVGSAPRPRIGRNAKPCRRAVVTARRQVAAAPFFTLAL